MIGATILSWLRVLDFPSTFGTMHGVIPERQLLVAQVALAPGFVVNPIEFFAINFQCHILARLCIFWCRRLSGGVLDHNETWVERSQVIGTRYHGPMRNTGQI